MKKLPLLILVIISACKVETTTVKFTADQSGHIIVPLVINDSIVYGIFDTGAPVSLLTEQDRIRTGLSFTDDSIRYHFALDEEYLISKRTKKFKVLANNLRFKLPVNFYVHHLKHPAQHSTWGVDIIDQANWLFDYGNNNLTISTNPIPFDTTNTIVISYRNVDLEVGNNKVCSLYSSTLGLLEDVLIDTGMMGLKINGVNHSILLFLPDSISYQRNPNLVKPQTLKNKNATNYDSVDHQFPLKNQTSGVVYYQGRLTFIKGAKRLACFDVQAYSALLGLSYAQGYSYMYMDTKNKKIYLKK